MFKVLRFVFLAVFGLLGLSWKIIQIVAAYAPDSVSRIDVPFERRSARYTWDGRRIID